MVTSSRFNNLKAQSLKMPVGILLLWAVLPVHCTVLYSTVQCTVTRELDSMILASVCDIQHSEDYLGTFIIAHMKSYICTAHSAI